MKRLKPAIAFSALALLFAGSLFDWPAPQKPSGKLPSATPAAQAQEPATRPDTNGDHRVVELAVHYLEHYGDTITGPATQARLYNERIDLLARFPESGTQLFQAAITTAFPELADTIFALMASLERYNRWLDNHELRLQGLPEMERYAEIWQQREAIFGALANQIWAEEQNPVEAKSAQLQQTLARLDQATELPLAELAHQLKTTANELYGMDLSRQLAGSGATGHALFTMDSVQQQLASLPPERRQQSINDLRRQLGYSEDAVQALARDDQRREEKWQAGKAYMEERRTLTGTLSGEPLKAALVELRQRHFGFSAPTIEREEREGFFRFQRERRYGLN
ncbi:hypothetical protein KUV59_08840 [Marinobacter daepoensis]|uniref:hypothetical protein n=1 Tax=Marinobacter daepoensis TaxID=262077 RepID=UPI001C9513ED|nr:hypothetical protein [Marinobacter daepoensis]MBY6033272.1 hypothetical protein [Marinobacter daepoensis]